MTFLMQQFMHATEMPAIIPEWIAVISFGIYLNN